MSHIITATFKLNTKNQEFFKKAVIAAKGEYLGNKSVKLFGTSVTGDAYQLPGWRYPVVITQNGEIKYDNYGGNWGETKILEKVIQDCVKRTIANSAQKQGFRESSTTTDAQGRMVIKLVKY